MMLPTALSKSWIYQMLPFIVSQEFDREFYWGGHREFYSRLGI